MLGLLEQIMRQSADRISSQVLNYAPGLLAALFILIIAFAIAKFLQWIILKIFKGISIDRFLRRTGLATSPEKLKTPLLVARVAFWLVLGTGFLIALSSFNSQLTSRIIETAVFLFPKIVVAAAIIIISAWLGRYFGRSILVWAVNENIPGPRKLAAAVRVLFIFAGVVAAADHLDFARSVFLAAFILLVGGLVLACSIALGLSGREFMQRMLHEEKVSSKEIEEQSIWRHL
ncbi:MAG: hypothetical protein JXA73_00570 [Acidobacteria bacterium]|nr:hypothetical protein [Acidobacteriota bacterium]